MERNSCSTSVSKNSRRINVEQRERLLDLVERNKDVLFGSKAQGNPAKNQVWQEIAVVLNQLGFEKSVDQWRKTWVDIKSAVKKKAAEMKAMRGTDLAGELQLSEEDYQVLRMCDIQVTDSMHELPSVSTNVRKINPLQQKKLLELIERNLPILCDPNIHRRLGKWSVIASSLNTLGPKKPTEQWRRIWIEMKKAVRRKISNASKHNCQPYDEYYLSDEDRQITRILETESLIYTQNTHRLPVGLDTTECEDMLSEDSSIHCLPEANQRQIEMESLKWLSHVDTILDFQKSLMDDQQSCDITLAFHGKCVKAHRLILSACSPFLRDILRDVPIGQEATIIIPDIEGDIVENVLNFIYTGETCVSLTNLDEFLNVIGNLGLKSPINFDYANNHTGMEEASFEVNDVSGELKQEIIEIGDDDEDIAIVDDSDVSLDSPMEESSDSTFSADVLNKPPAPDNVCDNDNLNTFNFATISAVGETNSSDLPHMKREESSSHDEDDINTHEPQTFQEQVNHSIAKNKSSLRKALLACLYDGLDITDAAARHDVSPALLQRQMTKYSHIRALKKRNKM